MDESRPLWVVRFALGTVLLVAVFILRNSISMTLESLRDYCLRKKGAGESLPFGDGTLVFKVMDKVFLLTDFEGQPVSFNVKCHPERAAQLREQYPCVHPGYHMSKKHWNTVMADGSVPDSLLREWIDHSYDLVVTGLPKAQKTALLEME